VPNAKGEGRQFVSHNTGEEGKNSGNAKVVSSGAKTDGGAINNISRRKKRGQRTVEPKRVYDKNVGKKNCPKNYAGRESNVDTGGLVSPSSKTEKKGGGGINVIYRFGRESLQKSHLKFGTD